MATYALVLGAVLAVVCVLFVARPFLREPLAASDALDEPGPLDRRRLELEEERDRALAALKELEFDHRTGKVSDEDYRDLVGPLRRRAAETLRALDRPGSTSARESVYGAQHKRAANEHKMTRLEPTAVVDPPQVPEPMPVPSEPPGPVTVPEPSPVPSEPPMPVPAPDPTPEPSPPQPEPPQGG